MRGLRHIRRVAPGCNLKRALSETLVPFANRRQTVTVDVGGVRVGSAHPIVVQSMTNTDTADAAATAAQVEALARAGSELVRVTVNNDAAAQAGYRVSSRWPL